MITNKVGVRKTRSEKFNSWSDLGKVGWRAFGYAASTNGKI